LFPATSPSTERPDAGFTIIEVLVALALVAVAIVAIGSLTSASVRGVRAFERHATLIQETRTAMAASIPPRDKLRVGRSSGQSEGYRWTVDVTPLGGDWAVPNSGAAWEPELVRIRVSSPSGATSDIRTVRLIKRAAE
jgi:general secretion pathway protein I